MNYTLVILGVILLVVIFILYRVLSEQGNVVTSIVTLDASTTNPSVNFSTLASPTSQKYYLSFWVNIESITGSADLFSIKNGPDDILKVGFKSDATLFYSIKSVEVPGLVDHTIMTNFPIQKWAFVVLSIDGNVVDMYYDGKMIRSEKLSAKPEVPTKDSTITFSKPNGIIFLAKFERNPTPIDPTTAWNKYMAGNGGNYFSNLMSSYGASFTITKDNVAINKVSLF